jgi:hypothetical protein
VTKRRGVQTTTRPCFEPCSFTWAVHLEDETNLHQLVVVQQVNLKKKCVHDTQIKGYHNNQEGQDKYSFGML